MWKLNQEHTTRAPTCEWVGMNIDIDARKRAEAALEESREAYRVLVESIDDGFCTLEVMFADEGQPCKYRFLQVNAAFERQTGLVDAAGRTARELVPN